MSTAEKYIAAAYGVFLLVLLAYLVIISAKLSRLDRDVAELVDLAERRRG